jgi:transcriptional regulator with XRE-family HTH domain
MEPLPPTVFRIAREFLGLTQDEVEVVSGIARSTIQRIERGSTVTPIYVRELRRLYEDLGIEFVTPASASGWGVINKNITGAAGLLNKLESIPPSKRKKQIPDTAEGKED